MSNAWRNSDKCVTTTGWPLLLLCLPRGAFIALESENMFSGMAFASYQLWKMACMHCVCRLLGKINTEFEKKRKSLQCGCSFYLNPAPPHAVRPNAAWHCTVYNWPIFTCFFFFFGCIWYIISDSPDCRISVFAFGFISTLPLQCVSTRQRKRLAALKSTRCPWW